MAVRDDFTAGEVLAAADLNDTFASKLDVANPIAENLLYIERTDAQSTLLMRRDNTGGSAVADTDTIAVFRAQGWDGSGWNNSAGIEFIIDGSVSTGDVPAKIGFYTQSDGGGYTARGELSDDGVWYLNNRAIQLSSGDWKTTPSQGIIRVATGAASSAGAVGMESGTTSSSTRYHIAFSNPNGVVGSISTSSSATSYNTSSDYRLKQDIEPISGALARLQQLNPIRFAWKVDPSTKVDGFLAHEAQAVVPEAVAGEKDEVDENGNPAYQGIDQSKLVPLLVAAVQELAAEVAALKAAQA